MSEIPQPLSNTNQVTDLPAECQDCVYRPADTGGNNGCSNIQNALGQLASTGDYLRSGRPGSLDNSLNTEHKGSQDFSSVGDNLFSLYNALLKELNKPNIGKVGQGHNPNPAPNGNEVTVCFRGLSNYAGDNVESGPIGIINFARTISTAISIGLKTPK